MKALTPSFGAYAATSAQLSGSLRHTHSRLVEFSEEVAFFGGEETEKMLVEREYAGLIKHENMVLQKRWWHGCIEEGIIKWLWGSFGVGIDILRLASTQAHTPVSYAFVLYLYFSSSLVSIASILALGRRVRFCICR